MAKTRIMLVEDDKSLREIYGVRLFAEGYDIVSAGDGEEALAMAIKERPQLIVTDVMMPKISGFDMLDILRSTTETKNIKVIMMTALSSEEQRVRGESLGADRYLVKSQVGIEDVVRVVHEVLEDAPGASANAPAPVSPQAPAPVTPIGPVRPPAAPIATPNPAPHTTPPAPVVQAAPQPFIPPAPVAPQHTAISQPPAAAPTPTTSAPQGQTQPGSIKTRIIQPLNDPNAQQVDMKQLLDQELAKEAGLSSDEVPTVKTSEQERQQLEAELAKFEVSTAPDITAEPSLNLSPSPQQQDRSAAPPPPPPPPGAPTA
ncbi:MAG TPA: response regulator [Candidatus Saccharimonadales bacterium]|jgi:CheY-like chemotaxis protein